MIVNTHLCGQGMLRCHPVQSSFDFTSIRHRSTLSFWVIGSPDFYDIALFVSNDIGAGYEVSKTQAHLTPWSESEELFRRIHHKVLFLNINLPGKRNLACASTWILWIV